MQVPVTIQSALQEAVERKVFPGGVLAIRRGGDEYFVACAGRLSSNPPGDPVEPSTIYDLASLTKPLATVTALALLVQEGRCRLHDRVDQALPELQQAPVGSATLRDLLTHSSGLPGWRGFYERLSPNAASLPSSPQARRDVGHRLLNLIAHESRLYEPGTRSLYSDLGFMVLGAIVERVSGMTLDRFLDDRITKPVGADPLCFLAANEPFRCRHGNVGKIAPTEYDLWRGRLLRGEVHDENAAALGGVAGHAGVFATAPAVLAVTGAWLQACCGRPSLLDPDVAQEFCRRQMHVAGSSWALGWDTPSAPSSAGRYLDPRSFGHLGYTGTSIWVDPVRELEVVVLSNRVHPTRTNESIRGFRPAIHELIYTEFVGKG